MGGFPERGRAVVDDGGIGGERRHERSLCSLRD